MWELQLAKGELIDDSLTMTLPNPRYCVSCGAILAQGARYCGTCGQAATAAAGRQQSGESVRIGGREQELAGIGSRFGALIVDGIVAAVINTPMLFVYNPWSTFQMEPDGTFARFDFSITWLLISAVYGLAFSWLWEAIGWSPGKALLGIRVRRIDGHRPGPIHGLARTTMKSLGGGVLLGYLWAFWDEKHQTWHDKAADTYVIKHITGGYDVADSPAPRLVGRKALWWGLGGVLALFAFQIGYIQSMIYVTDWINSFESEFERDGPMVVVPLYPEPSEGTAKPRLAAPPPTSYLPVFSSSSTQFPSGSTTIAIRSPGRTSSGPEGTS
jgi:uncharacterized RDD family membrane protein YckC